MLCLVIDLKTYLHITIDKRFILILMSFLYVSCLDENDDGFPQIIYFLHQITVEY